MQKIQSYPGARQVFVATEEVSHLCAVAIVYSADGINRVELDEEATQEKGAGIAYGAQSGQVSGQLVRVVTQGIISGVILGVDCLVGDRLMIASAGRLMPLNTITPAGAVSAYIPITGMSLLSGQIASGVLNEALLSGLAQNISGYATLTSAPVFSSGSLVGTSFNTARVLAKALNSGSAGVGIPVLVTLGG